MTATLTRRFATMGGEGSVHLESDVAGSSRLAALADAVEELFADVETALTPFRDDSESRRSTATAARRSRRPPPRRARAGGAARRRADPRAVDATVPVGTRPRPAARPELDGLLAAAPPRRAARPAENNTN